MNTIFRSAVLISQVASQAAVVLEEEFLWEWNIENHCGPRPQGPHYPYPPATNGSYKTAGNCDIVEDGLYIFNYACETTCETDSSKTVILLCNCLHRVGPVERTVPCEWKYEYDYSCAIPEEIKYDWECDPRKETCPEGQYLEPAMPENPFGLFSWNTTYGNVTEMIQGGMPGYVNHIYISPTMVQNMPDSSDGNNSTEHNSSSDDAENAAKLARAEEKTRGLRSMMKEMQNAFETEREQYQIQIDEKEVGKKDLQNQVKIMQELLRYKLKEDDSAEKQNIPATPASRTITVELQDTNSKKEMLNDPGREGSMETTAPEAIEYEDEEELQLELELGKPILSNTDQDEEEPHKAHKKLIKKARGRVQKIKSSRPRSSGQE